MKKKTKFKLKNDLKGAFIVAISLCCVGIVVCSFLFYKSLFRVIRRINEKPIATITYKYKTAQRKFIDRVVWDRLRQNSAIYNGDTIYTGPLSEATVRFGDQSALELSPNTMAQVFRDENSQMSVALDSGAVMVDSNGAVHGFTLTSDGVSVGIEAGSLFHAKKESASEDGGGAPLEFQMVSGNAVMNNGFHLDAGSAFSVSKDGSTRPILSMIQPKPNQKIFYHTKGNCIVPFEYKGSSNLDLLLTVASDKDFTNVVRTLNTRGVKNIRVSLPAGVYYWRLSEKSESGMSIDGRFQIISSLAPALVSPTNGYAFQYRLRKPQVRFIWKESQQASGYRLLVSKDLDFSTPDLDIRSTSTSAIVSSLEAGSYFWRVVPLYTAAKVDLDNHSAIGSFDIIQSGQLRSPRLKVPAYGAFVDNTLGKGVIFSWNQESEATSYRILVADNKELKSPIIDKTVLDNYFNTKNNGITLSNREWFWAVSQIDSEGNNSPLSSVSSFYCVDGKVEQRTLFPPDNYTLWDMLSQDMRFTWRCNIPADLHFQIAKDKAFSNIIIDSVESNLAKSGVKLAVGDYYWRISCKLGDKEHHSEAKRLTIVPSLRAVTLVQPLATKPALILPQVPYQFIWQESDKVDYYRVKIFKEGSLVPVIDQNFITTTRYNMDLSKVSNGRYYYQIHGYKNESANTSRRGSIMATSPFVVRRIIPVSLGSPNGLTYEGLDIEKKPPVCHWSSQEEVVSSTFILQKIQGSSRETKLTIPNPPRAITLQNLSSGTYYWTVRATTKDNINISATSYNRFVVTPIPPFNPPRDLKTSKSAYNGSDLLEKPRIDFSWQNVNGANIYEVVIYDQNRRVLATTRTKNLSYEFANLKLLSKGEFSYSVKALFITEATGELIRDGKEAYGKFSIDFSTTKTQGKNDTGNIFGQK